jgi:hypothetical protein
MAAREPWMKASHGGGFRWFRFLHAQCPVLIISKMGSCHLSRDVKFLGELSACYLNHK